MNKSIVLFILLAMISSAVHSQRSDLPNVVLPAGERHPYFNKFAYILDDDADSFFLAKAYKIVESKKDNGVDFMLFCLENFDIYGMPMPESAQYGTEPALATLPDNEYEYTIRWENKNKSYKLNISNRYKEVGSDLVFKGMALQIKEENSSYILTKEIATTTTEIYSHYRYFKYKANKDTTAYETPPMIKDRDSSWDKLNFLDIHPYVESNISYIDKNKSAQNYSILIRDFFSWGNVGVPTEQSLDIDGNKINANKFLKKCHIKVRESSEYHKILGNLSYFFNKNFETIQSKSEKMFSKGLWYREQIEEYEE